MIPLLDSRILFRVVVESIDSRVYALAAAKLPEKKEGPEKNNTSSTSPEKLLRAGCKMRPPYFDTAAVCCCSTLLRPPCMMGSTRILLVLSTECYYTKDIRML